jgi:hypothetical protein
MSFKFKFIRFIFSVIKQMLNIPTSNELKLYKNLVLKLNYTFTQSIIPSFDKMF